MIRKITNADKLGNSHISILYPGKVWGGDDSGLGSLGRIDQANIGGGTTIKMHPHVNDEILSYFRTGSVVHTDSAGNTETITRKRLMLMKSGSGFHHEEQMLDKLEGLQIFLRPRVKDDDPEVLFYDLPQENSQNALRLLAADHARAPLALTSQTEIYDMQLDSTAPQGVRATTMANAVLLLYVFQGSIRVNDAVDLTKGEGLLFDESALRFDTTAGAELVLFVTNARQACYKGGMYSGRRD